MEDPKLEIEVKVPPDRAGSTEEVGKLIEAELERKLSVQPTDFFSSHDRVTINVVTKQFKV
jgi:hypothetical protein